MEINQHPEVLLYTRIRMSPYFYASRCQGVQRYSFYNHMYHPRMPASRRGSFAQADGSHTRRAARRAILASFPTQRPSPL